MKKNKWIVLAALALCMALLTGCQLALKENSDQTDRFAGLSVRLTGSSDYDRYEPHEVDGQVMIVPLGTNETGETFVMSDFGEWFSDVHLHVNSTDEGEEYTISGTLYVCDELIPSGVILKAEEVYQRPDGSMYAVNGGHNYSGHLSGLKIDINQSRTATDTEGKKSSESCTVTLRVEKAEHVILAELLEMDADNQEISRHILNDQFEIPLSAETEWVLLHETLKDGSVRRTAFNAPLEEENIVIRIPNELGVCVPHGYRLVPPEEPQNTTPASA